MTRAATAARGAAWTSAASIASQLLSFTVFVILARLVAPQAYGLIAVTMALVLLLGAISNLGLQKLLVQMEVCGPMEKDSAFCLSVVLGLLLALGLWTLAPRVAQFAGAPELTRVIRALSPVVVLRSLEVVPLGIMTRELRFKDIAVRSIMAIVLGGMAGIAVALRGQGVWALVIQELVKSAYSLVALWLACGWSPGRSVTVTGSRDMLRKSLHFLGSDLTRIAHHQLDRFLIGSFLGVVQLGFYTIAAKINRVATSIMQDSLVSVALPVFARCQNEKAQLLATYLQSQRLGTAIILPVFVLLMLTADSVIPLLLGDQWQASSDIVKVLCLASCAICVGMFNTPLLQAAGRADLAMRLNLLNLLLGISAFFLTFRFGILAISMGFAVRSWLMIPIEIEICRRLTGMDLRLVYRGLLRILLSLAPMTLVVALMEATGRSAPDWLSLMLNLSLGVATYLLALALTDRVILSQILAIPGLLLRTDKS